MLLIKFWKILGLENERRITFTFFILLVISLLEFIGLILVIPYVNIMIDSDNTSAYIGEILKIIDVLKITGNE